MKVTKKYDNGGLQTASEIVANRYDGLGRRIVKEVKNSADLDGTYRYYYDGQSLVEVHNGSEQVIQQFVWGRQYIDELVQIGINSDPAADNTADSFYFAMADSNYNILGVVDDTGALKERYEYTAYGQRKVFISPGDNDPSCMALTYGSRRMVVGTIEQGWGINPFGHQGLYHDEESGLVYNRARHLSPSLGRFMQRDPLEYVDGMNVYQYVSGSPITATDPLGLDKCNGECPVPWTAQKKGGMTWQYGCYCGLEPSPPRKTIPSPIDALDKCCRAHDACYTPPPGGPPLTKKQIRACDEALVQCARDALLDGECVSPQCEAAAKAIIRFFR